MLIYFFVRKPTKPLYVKACEEKSEGESKEDPFIAKAKEIFAKISSKLNKKDKKEE
jgi:hypothetical protein